jgi:predicted transglutaminase-like cysteine proteinase
MADPLSIAASIITVVQVTDQVLTCCYAYVGRVKTAAADIDRAVQETSLLKGLLLNLLGLVQDEPDNERFNSLVAPAGALSICTEALKEMEMKLRPTKQTRLTAKERLLWPFESKKLEEILVRIDRQKPAILLALATDNLDTTRKIQTGVEDIQSSIESAHLHDKREKILNWLRPNDPKDRHTICRQQHEDGTNQWVLDNPDFREWTHKPRRNIWVSLE